MTWIALAYRDFYDVPRAFVVEHAGKVYFFDCPFDESADDYPGFYRVYEMPDDLSSLAARQSWEDFAIRGKPIGQVPVQLVKFDKSHRELVESQVFDVIE